MPAALWIGTKARRMLAVVPVTSQEKLIRVNREYLRLSRGFARGLRLRLAIARGEQVPESEEDLEALGLVELACSRCRNFLRP